MSGVIFLACMVALVAPVHPGTIATSKGSGSRGDTEVCKLAEGDVTAGTLLTSRCKMLTKLCWKVSFNVEGGRIVDVEWGPAIPQTHCDVRLCYENETDCCIETTKPCESTAPFNYEPYTGVWSWSILLPPWSPVISGNGDSWP
jgi:hypothetical protein